AVIMKIRVPDQEGAEGNAAERYRGDNNMAALGVAAVIEEYAHESLTFRDAVACEIIWGLLAKAKLRSRLPRVFWMKQKKLYLVWRSSGLRVGIVMKKRRVGGYEYMTLTGKLKEDTWLKGAESGFELRYLTFGRHLEEIHVTWAHLEKKRTRLRTNTKTLQDLVSEPRDDVTIYTRRRHTSSSDGVTTSLDGVSPHRLNSGLEDSTL
ncbi:hypothetical protein Tco_1047195, partial [Tanacetum coccineum]